MLFSLEYDELCILLLHKILVKSHLSSQNYATLTFFWSPRKLLTLEVIPCFFCWEMGGSTIFFALMSSLSLLFLSSTKKLPLPCFFLFFETWISVKENPCLWIAAEFMMTFLFLETPMFCLLKTFLTGLKEVFQMIFETIDDFIAWIISFFWSWISWGWNFLMILYMRVSTLQKEGFKQPWEITNNSSSGWYSLV